jgi:PTS system nitrogen regulatory IIA component
MSGAAQFGASLRLLRINAGLSLRAMAERVGVSSAYLSRVEHGIDGVPTPDRLLRIAQVLDLPPPLLLELANKVAPFVASYLEEVPAAGALFLDVARRRLTPAQLARVKLFIEREFAAGEQRAGAPRLRPLLAEERIVLQLSCTDIQDAFDVVAPRLATGEWGATRIARELARREAEASTALGGGVAMPHLPAPGCATAAALVTLGKPLPASTPDGQPLRLLLVLLHGQRGREHLALLAHAARLAQAPELQGLCEARSPAEAMERLGEIEAIY